MVLNIGDVTPPSKHSVGNWDTGHQEVSRCSTRDEPQGMYHIYTSTQSHIVLPLF